LDGMGGGSRNRGRARLWRQGRRRAGHRGAGGRRGLRLGTRRRLRLLLLRLLLLLLLARVELRQADEILPGEEHHAREHDRQNGVLVIVLIIVHRASSPVVAPSLPWVGRSRASRATAPAIARGPPSGARSLRSRRPFVRR